MDKQIISTKEPVDVATKSVAPRKTTYYSKSLADYIGDWGKGLNKDSLLGNIHRNLLGVDELGKLRPKEDLAFFLLQCRQYDLNPIKKEIYAVYQKSQQGGKWVEKLEPIVSIHGLRTLARRCKSPIYAYTGAAKLEYSDNAGEKKLESATVEVFGRLSITSREVVKVGEYTAYYDEFVKLKKDGTPTAMWAKSPRMMLSKCSEANCLRMAFGLGEIYIPEEMPSTEAIMESINKEENEE